MRKIFAFLMLAPVLTAAPSTWPLWDAFADRFVDGQGRVVDHDASERSTSEGQAYGLFFALVAGDRQRFDQILGWTAKNLAHGDLTQSLPSWLWGHSSKTGKWTVLDHNSASDADVWLGYTLMEAGRLWSDRPFDELGTAVARRVGAEEVVDLPGRGPVLLPGRTGFHEHPDAVVLNPSYLAPQPLLRFSVLLPEGPWAEIVGRVPEIWSSSTVHGFVADWCAGQSGKGFWPKGQTSQGAKASYDAIRVYLWTGMLPPEFPARADLMASVNGMVDYLRDNDFPPEEVSPRGAVKPSGSIGFSAAVSPLLSALGEIKSLATQRKRLKQGFDSASQLYGRPARYYDQCLLLFASGWSEDRFRFDSRGQLIVRWRTDP